MTSSLFGGSGNEREGGTAAGRGATAEGAGGGGGGLSLSSLPGLVGLGTGLNLADGRGEEEEAARGDGEEVASSFPPLESPEGREGMNRNDHK